MSDYKNLKIGIVDLKLNNIFSICQLFKYLNLKISIIDNYTNLKKFDLVVLPGDGTYKEGMKRLFKINLASEIISYSKIKEKKLLGICLGMQMLFDSSSEFGFYKGLGLVPGKVDKLSNKNSLVPNIGWRELNGVKKKLFSNFNKKFFYFSHSFYGIPKEKKIITSYICHDDKKICSSFVDNNIFGIQFHPEKSHMDGVKLIKKILDLKV